jgi:hypothetical protein
MVTFDHLIAMGYSYPHTNKVGYIISRTERPDYSLNLIFIFSTLVGKYAPKITQPLI